MKETRLTLAGAALNQTPLDWDNNLQNIKDAITEAILDGEIRNEYEPAFAFLVETGKKMGLDPVNAV